MATLTKRVTDLTEANTPGASDTVMYAAQGSADRKLVVGKHLPSLNVDGKIPSTYLAMSAFFLGLASAENAAALRTSLGVGSAGTRSDSYFASAAQGGLAASAVQPAALSAALTNYATTAAVASALAGKLGTGAEAIAAIEGVTDPEILSGLLDHLLSNSTAIPNVATFQDWRDEASDIKTLGISFWAGLTKKQAMPFGATVLIDYGDASGEDPDEGMCRSLRPSIAAISSTASVASIKGVSGLLIDQTVELLWTNSGGGTRTVSIGTGSGITITHALGITNPGLGSSAGDWLKAGIWLKSATEGVVLGYAKK